MLFRSFFILLVYSYLDPTNVRLLFVTIPGQLILGACVVLNMAAYFWALKILNADI